jgi:hypothetical protein
LWRIAAYLFIGGTLLQKRKSKQPVRPVKAVGTTNQMGQLRRGKALTCLPVFFLKESVSETHSRTRLEYLCAQSQEERM